MNRRMNSGLGWLLWAAAAAVWATAANAQEAGVELAPLPPEGPWISGARAPSPAWRLGDVSVGHVVASRGANDLAGVATASSTVEYQFDDGTFEGGVSSDLLGIGVAQSFTLDRPGEVEWVEACWRRVGGDDEDRHGFRITIHEDSGGEPGDPIKGSGDPADLDSAEGTVLIENMPVGQVVCVEAGNWGFETVPAGTYWILTSWLGTRGLALLAGQAPNALGGLSKELMLDLNGPGATNVLAYEAAGLADLGAVEWAPMAENPRAAAIRFRVEFDDEDSDDDADDNDDDGDSDDDGDDDDDSDHDDDDDGDADDGDGDGYPETPTGRGFSTCVPSGPALGLADGFRVSMCFDDPNLGEHRDARDWRLDATDSGLLYFFERNNVEVLIKVLDGCRINGHHWVFVAPVTDLAFNLHVDDGKGAYWTHRNRAGETAEAKRDTSAFDCD